MKAKRSLSGVLTFCVMHTLVVSAAVEPSGEVRAALKHAGGNHTELETALREVNGKDTEYLITHASQYDLANLTAQQIIENVTYARRVHEALLYLGKKLDDEMWQEWVLPHRVLEEDLSLWRKDYYERMQPVIAGLKTTEEVVEAIHTWLLVPGEKDAKLIFSPGGENRCTSPSQLMKTGGGSCGELCLMYVQLLRSVGIPTRHCVLNWTHGSEDRHFYVEYWDGQRQQWIAVDASVERRLASHMPRRLMAAGFWNTLALYALPGHAGMKDFYNTANWEECLAVTANVIGTYPTKVNGQAGSQGRSMAYLWKHQGWRLIASAKPESDGAAAEIHLADSKAAAVTVLFAQVNGGELWWGLQRPSPAANEVRLERAVSGECLRWVEEKGKD